MLSTSSTIKSPSPFWLTLRQANEAGGHMRKGEQSQIVVFWKVDRVADDTVIELDAEAIESELGRRRFVLRYFRVWNLEQCELPSVVVDLLPEIETHQHDAIDAAEGIIAGNAQRARDSI